MEIDVAGPMITDKDIEIVLDALKNGWYGKQAYYYCELFQNEFAKYHNRKYGIMTPNCTSAIHLLLKGLNIKENDEVIVPDCTWIGSTAGVRFQGATTVFADIEKDNWCIDPKSVEKNITKNTKAIIVVNLHGNMANMNDLQKICDNNGLYLIEDAAQSLGSKYNNIKSGKFGISSTFSFHRTKTISTGEGGMLLLDDDNLYDKCMFIRDHGRSNVKNYWIDEITCKYMPFNVQAALGYAQFLRLEELIDIKRKQFNFYKENLKEIPYLQFNHEPKNVYNSFWVTGIVLGKEFNMNKIEFIKKMEKLNIPIRPFFYPLSSMPPYKMEGEKARKHNIVTYDISNRGINLPCAFNLTREKMEFICNGIKKVLSDN